MESKFPALQTEQLLGAPHDMGSDSFDVDLGGELGVIKDSAELQARLRELLHSGLKPFAILKPRTLPEPRYAPLTKAFRDIHRKAKSSIAGGNALLNVSSFYRLCPIEDPSLVADRCRHVWNKFNVLGRVYVAHEGINAQVAVPEVVWGDFLQAMDGILVDGNGAPAMPREVLHVEPTVQASTSWQERPFTRLQVDQRCIEHPISLYLLVPGACQESSACGWTR